MDSLLLIILEIHHSTNEHGIENCQLMCEKFIQILVVVCSLQKIS